MKKQNKIKNKILNANEKNLEILMQILWKMFAQSVKGRHKIKLEFLKFCNVAEEFYFLFYFVLLYIFTYLSSYIL